jgi:hypothetical protein
VRHQGGMLGTDLLGVFGVPSASSAIAVVTSVRPYDVLLLRIFSTMAVVE